MADTVVLKDTDGVVPTEVETVEPAEMPLPSDPRAIFQGGLFVLALLACCYAAGKIVLPVILAFILKLLLQPALRLLERVHVPRVLGTVLLICLLFGSLIGFGAALSRPAMSWAAKLPEGVPRLQEHLSFLREPIEVLRQFLQYADHVTEGAVVPISSSPTVAAAAPPPAAPAPGVGSVITEMLFSGTRAFATGFFTTVLLLFFLLMSGDTFLRRLVEILPRFSDKRQAVEISQQIERDISAYLATISVMNLAVGVATGAIMSLCGLGDPLLWGAVALLLNYIPILGPMAGAAIFLMAGLLSIDTLWGALLPAALYLFIHVTESALVTPMLVAKRFTLNPVLVILGLVFWYWMWGVAGAVLAVPMLAITKIVCDRIRPLAAFGHFLEG